MRPERFLVAFEDGRCLLTPEKLLNLHNVVETVLEKGIEGDFVELGCFKGGSAAYINNIIQRHDSDAGLWLYDSFSGLPEWTVPDHGSHQIVAPGQIAATQNDVVTTFEVTDVSMENVEIIPGWFEDLEPDDLPSQIAFAHLDGDLYRSIRVSLELIYGRMSDGAVCLIDDYNAEIIPGCKRAVDEFMANCGEEVVPFDGSTHAYFVKV